MLFYTLLTWIYGWAWNKDTSNKDASNVNNAYLKCLKLSEYAYVLPEENPIKTNIQYLRNNYGFLLLEDNILYVCFRGTDSILDICTDVAILMKDSVHTGFFDRFNYLKDEIAESIIEKQTVVFTGHSLGGAVATIAGHYFSGIYPTVDIHVCTFGSPKVGNQTFVAEFNARVQHKTRIYIDDDPIPMLPIELEYWHVDNGICLNDKCYDIFINPEDHKCCNYEKFLQMAKFENI